MACWEASVAIIPSVLGWLTTAALMEANVDPLIQRPRTPQLLQQGASLTQSRIHATREDNMLIQNLHVRHLDQSVVRGRFATILPWRMALRHVVRVIQQQRRVHVCQVQRLTNVSPPVLLIAKWRQTALIWELKVVEMLRADGTRVIANLLRPLSCSWCDLLSSFPLLVAKTNMAETQGMVCFCADVAGFGNSCASTRQ